MSNEVTEVHFRWMESGWRNEERDIPVEQLKQLLVGAVLVDTDIWDGDVQGVTMKLKDGRKCELTRTERRSYGDYIGYVSVFISEEW